MAPAEVGSLLSDLLGSETMDPFEGHQTVFVGSDYVMGTSYAWSSTTGAWSGTWDATTRVCTLTSDLTESVEVTTDGVTLDCLGHSITGTGSSGTSGVSLVARSGVTVMNCFVSDFT